MARGARSTKESWSAVATPGTSAILRASSPRLAGPAVLAATGVTISRLGEEPWARGGAAAPPPPPRRGAVGDRHLPPRGNRAEVEAELGRALSQGAVAP